jgi:A/G-specific adenine glycosylase
MDRGTSAVKCEVPAGYGVESGVAGPSGRTVLKYCPLVGIFPREASQEWDGMGSMGTRTTNRRRAEGRPNAKAFRERLVSWYRERRRDLPWRRNTDAYRVWVSEVMLQQTRAEVVAPKYLMFLERFPTVSALASARLEEVLAIWSGLGYYRRARHLHEAAGRILLDHGGDFPRDPKAALKLPGVGVYIAHAVLSIAYGAPLAVVDGNVVRVLSRVGKLASRSPAAFQPEADRLLDPNSPGDANQALMELGATVCVPLSPKCEQCPIASLCAARSHDCIADYPPAPNRIAVETVETSLWLVRDRRSRLWLEKRSDPPLRGMWMLPWREGTDGGTDAEEIGSVRHAIMNRRYTCTVRELRGGPEAIPGRAAGMGQWVARDEIPGLPHSSLLVKALALADAPRTRGSRGSRGKRSDRDPRPKARP